jgi:hypothetical protein
MIQYGVGPRTAKVHGILLLMIEFQVMPCLAMFLLNQSCTFIQDLNRAKMVFLYS